MYKDVMSLINYEEITDEYGDTKKVPIPREVLCNVLSIGQQEFYQAQTQGLKPELKFVLADYLDYNNEKEVIYENYKYNVLRTYRKEMELEITVYGGVRNVSA